MNPEIVREEIEELTRQIKAAAEVLRLLKRKRKNLEAYMDPKVRREPTKET